MRRLWISGELPEHDPARNRLAKLLPGCLKRSLLRVHGRGNSIEMVDLMNARDRGEMDRLPT